MLAVRIRAIDGKGLSPPRFAALLAGRYQDFHLQTAEHAQHTATLLAQRTRLYLHCVSVSSSGKAGLLLRVHRHSGRMKVADRCGNVQWKHVDA
jgi:hypothetical protein